MTRRQYKTIIHGSGLSAKQAAQIAAALMNDKDPELADVAQRLLDAEDKFETLLNKRDIVRA